MGGLLPQIIQAFMNRGKGENAPQGGGQEGFGHTLARGLTGSSMGGGLGMSGLTGGSLIEQLIRMFSGGR
jgi:hypothetical protein